MYMYMTLYVTAKLHTYSTYMGVYITAACVTCVRTFDDPVLQAAGVRAPVVDEVLEYVLGRLRFASAALATDDDRLTLLQHLHVAVRLVR